MGLDAELIQIRIAIFGENNPEPVLMQRKNQISLLTLKSNSFYGLFQGLTGWDHFYLVFSTVREECVLSEGIPAQLY